MLIKTTAMPAQGSRSRVTRDRYEQRARRREQLIATVVDLQLPVGRRRSALAALEREADGLSRGLLERLAQAGYPEPGRILGAVRNGNLLAVQSVVRACHADRLAGCLDRVAAVAAWAHTEPARLF